MSHKPIIVVGAGLAGCEAAWQLAQAGLEVVLQEMRPLRQTPAHRTGGFAELVCSNSLRSDDATYNAVGLLHDMKPIIVMMLAKNILVFIIVWCLVAV